MSSRRELQRTSRWIALTMVAGMGSSGCAATHMSIRHGEFSTHTEVSESVFLELDTQLPATVYVSETSTMEEDVTVRPMLDEHLSSMGYGLSESPEQATYVLQLNHRKLAETELSGEQSVNDAVELAWMAGVGAGVAADILGHPEISDEVALAVGVIAFLLDAKSKHLAYTLTTDVLLTESILDGQSLERRYHETQVVGGASKVNLSKAEALPSLVNGVSRSISRLLPQVKGARSRRAVVAESSR